MPNARRFLVAAVFGVLTACAAGQASRHIQVQTNPLASQFTPRQVARLLADLGYQPIRWHDFESDQTGVTIATQREVKMKFNAPEHPQWEVYFRFYIDTKKLQLGLVEPNRNQLTPEADASYQELLRSLQDNFGTANVTELKYSLIPPP